MLFVSNMFMKKILLAVSIFVLCFPDASSQFDKRLSIQVSPLFSFIQYERGQFENWGSQYTSPTGISCSAGYEMDFGRYFSVHVGLNYERRKYNFDSGMLWDTISTIIIGDEIFPFRFTENRNMDFLAVPVGFSIQFINHPRFRVYQLYDAKFSFMISSGSELTQYYQGGIMEKETSSSIDDKQDVVYSICSAIGVCQMISENLGFKIEPGFSYTINNITDTISKKLKCFDLSVNIGIVYGFQ